MSRPLSISDPPFAQGSQEGNPGGNTATKATSSIGNISYEAAQAGTNGNEITVTHQLAQPIAATHSELEIGGMTYSAKNAGSAGNSITVEHTSAAVAAVSASMEIEGLTYSARSPGSAGNSITVTHESSAIPAATASRSIGGMTYSANATGSSGNLISIAHELAPDIAATKASGLISGITYEAKAAGTDGNSISVTVNSGSPGSAGTATLSRAFSTTGTASFNIAEKSGYYGSPTTVKLTSSAITVPNSQMSLSLSDDSNLTNTSLLLRAGQSSAARNDSFTDSSLHAYSITRSGNVQQGRFSPFSKAEKEWSVYMPTAAGINTNTLMVSGTQSVANIGTNFSLEFWFKGDEASSYGIVAGKTRLNSDTNDVWFSGVQYSGADKGKFYFVVHHTTNQVRIFQSTSRVDDNRWHHCAFVKQGLTYTVFVDGMAESSQTFNTSIHSSTSYNLTIGGSTNNATGGDYGRSNCYISNLRITNTAIYTASFTPPSSPLTAIAGTIFLGCQDKFFKDNGPGSYSISVQQGKPTVSVISPFATQVSATGSGYWDGVGDLVTVSDNNAFTFDADFAIEAWIYPTKAISQSVVSHWQSGIATACSFVMQLTATNALRFAYGIGASNVGVQSAANTIILNQWQHVAVTRNGTTVRLFVNGVVVLTSTVSGGLNNCPSPLTVGSTQSTDYFNGYISGLRIVKGSAVYAGAYTPPTSTLTAISGTSLLLNFEDAAITDTTSNMDIEVGGSAVSSSMVTKFGSASTYFDGVGDYLSIGSAGHNALDLGGTTDFTIEAWVYPAVTILSNAAIYANYGGARSGAHLLRITGGKAAFYVYPSTDILMSTTTIPVGAWTHIAVARSAGTTRLYINGIMEASTATAYAALATDPSHPATVGGYWQAAALESNGYFTGYIEDLRVTKGVARYAAVTSVVRELSGTTELIRMPTGATVAQVLAVVGPSGTNPSARVSITSSSSGTLSSTDPVPNNGATTSGGVAPSGLSVSLTGRDIAIALAGGGATNTEVKNALEANAGISALVTMTNPGSGSASTAAKTFLSGGANAMPGALSALVSGSAITISVPAGTTNTALKAYLETMPAIAGNSGLINMSNPTGNAPTSSGPFYLVGGIDASAGSLSAYRSGTDIIISVPAGTSNANLRTYLESISNIAGPAGIINLTNATGAAPIISGPVSLQGGTDASAGSLDATVTGSAISISVPSGTANAVLKEYLETIPNIAGASGMISLSGASGTAPVSSGPLVLQGGTDEVPGQLEVSVSGNALTVSVPASTLAADVASAINGDNSAASLVTATATDSGLASTTGSAQLAGGQD